MAVYNFAEVKNIIFNNPNKGIVTKAKASRKLYSRHTHGADFKSHIQKVDYCEDEPCFNARKKYSISNKDMLKRVLNREDQVFSTSASAFFGLKKADEDEMNALIGNVINGMSIYKWVQTYALQAYRSDPMGIIFMEADEVLSVDGVNFTTPKCYPTYKSSEEIYDYLPNGRNLEHICFSLTKDQLINYGIIEAISTDNVTNYANGSSTPTYYRFVDDKSDTIYKRESETLVVVKMRQRNPLPHSFDKVPGFIVSDLFQYDDPQCFGSPLQFVIEIAECFMHDRSVRELHKMLHGFPKAVEPLLACTTCSNGGTSTGLKGGYACPDCTLPGQSIGTGYKLKTTPADVARFPLEMLKDISHFKVGDIFGYISPDIEGLNLMSQNIIDQEELIECTYWGTKPVKSVNFNGKQSIDETATKTLINLQPAYSRLNMTSDWAEKSINWIADFMGQFFFREDWKGPNIILSRNYILELPEDLLTGYLEMKKNDLTDAELDAQWRRYLMAKYKSNPEKLATQTKFYEMQPYPHKTEAQVAANPNITIEDKIANSYFGEWMRTLKEEEKTLLTKEQLTVKYTKYIADKIAAVKAEAAEQAAADASLNIAA